MTPQTREWAEQYQAGASLRTIAAAHGVTHKTVLYRFRAEGVQTRHRNCAHNPPPTQHPWAISICLDCGDERRVRSDGYCWHCSRSSA